MGAVKSKSPEQLLARRQQVSELYLQCHSMADIGRQLGVTATTIYKDICWAREQWRTRAAEAIGQMKQRELARIDYLEVEAWKGWQRSCKPILIESEKEGFRPGDQGGEYDEKTRERRTSAGDPRFLSVVDRCIESRRKILGLDAPIKSELAVSGDDLMQAIIAGQQRVQQLQGSIHPDQSLIEVTSIEQ